MTYRDVRGPDGRMLFRFDPDRDLIEIRDRGQMYTIDLSQYRPQAAVIEIDPPAVLRGRLDTEQPFAL